MLGAAPSAQQPVWKRTRHCAAVSWQTASEAADGAAAAWSSLAGLVGRGIDGAVTHLQEKLREDVNEEDQHERGRSVFSHLRACTPGVHPSFNLCKRFKGQLREDSEPEMENPDSSSSRVKAYLTGIGVPPSLYMHLDDFLEALVTDYVAYPALENFLVGYEAGAMSLAVMQFTDPDLIGLGWQPLSPWDVGIIVSSKIYGSFGGSLIAFSQCGDISSRDVLIWSGGGLALANLIAACAASPRILITARLLSGLLEGISAPSRVAYTAETVEARLKHASVAVRGGSYGIGAVVGAVVGVALLQIPAGWHLMLGLGVLPSAISTLGMVSLPHSPRWILCSASSASAVQQRVAVQQRAVALDALKMLREPPRCPPGACPLETCRLLLDWERRVQVELDSMCNISAPSADDPEGSVSIVRDFLALPGTWTIFWVMFFSQTNGTMALFYYKANVLSAIGLGNHVGALTAFLMAIRSMVIPWGAVMSGNIGYRDSLILGSLCASLSMAGLRFCDTLVLHPGSASALSLGLLVSNTAAFQVSFGTISYQMAAELFPQQHRQRGLAWAHICSAPLKAISLQAFPVVLAHAGPGPLWTFYALMNAAGSVILFKVLPDLQGHNLEDIERELQTKA